MLFLFLLQDIHSVAINEFQKRKNARFFLSIDMIETFPSKVKIFVLFMMKRNWLLSNFLTLPIIEHQSAVCGCYGNSGEH